MKKTILLLILSSILASSLFSCSPSVDKTPLPTTDITADPPTKAPIAPASTVFENTYEMISQEEAKELMDSQEDYIILDVRTKQEYDMGHIKNAILIPDYEITARAEKELPDKNALILVYCRSGNRSKTASQALADLGYTNIKEFGGIITWQYGTVTD